MSRDILQRYVELGLRFVIWPRVGDDKGPREANWPQRVYTLDDYHDGDRVGLLCGVEIAPDHHTVDLDIDWAAGSVVAQHLLPPTGFIYGRAGKRISHCVYTTPDAVSSCRYEDIDKTVLIELRGTKLDGSIGLQSMAPPSIWSKNGVQQPLTFVKCDSLAHIDSATLTRRACLAAIAMILAKHFGLHGFGHEARLCWAGCLLRAGLSLDECVAIGEAISAYCDNREIADIRLVLETTARHLNTHDSAIIKKVKGAPSLIKLLGDHGKLVIKRINEWLGRDRDFIRNGDGIIARDHQENIKRALTMMDIDLSFNEFSDKLLVNRSRPLEDRELTDLWLRIDEEYRFRPSYAFFEKVIKKIGWDNPFHPVKDYFATLTWDGTPRIAEWLIRGGGADDTPFIRAISAIVLIAAARRIRQPGCKYDEMLVLESGQGMYKSTALRSLCPNPEWFSDDLQLNLKSQQMIETTLGKWILEASELGGLRTSQVEQLKSLLSKQSDGPARLAYAHLPVERNRQFIMIGTTNITAAYLMDSTGARRFWPVTVRKFDIAWLLQCRDQLWAEAVHCDTRGDTIRLPETFWPEASAQQEKRREIDAWEEPVTHAILDTPEFHDYRDEHTRVITARLYTAINLPIERQDRIAGHRLSAIMQRLGFKPTTVRVSGARVQRGYISIERHWHAQHADISAHDDVPMQTNTADRVPGDEPDDVPF